MPNKMVPVIQQRLKCDAESICIKCQHRKVCRAIDNQPCVECNQFTDANGVTVQEWISVKDRLPDADGCYIVTACDEGCSCGEGIWYDTVVVEAEHYKGSWSWNENGTEYDITCFVTHWMSLPQPPKGE